jgi:hypothetical protein
MMCSTSWMLPVALLAGIARALRMPSGSMLNAVAEPAAEAAARRKSRRFFDVMLGFDLQGRNMRDGEQTDRTGAGSQTTSINGVNHRCYKTVGCGSA